jgi:hypothetical protein
MNGYFSTAVRSKASPTGWIEIADAFEGDPEDLAALSAAGLLANPMARVLSANLAVEADLADSAP